MSASNANDPLRADLDKLQKMLEENRAKCAEAKMRLEARAVAEKDGEAGWDQFYAEIRGKIHSLMDYSREIRTSHISMEVLLEASRQIHHESLAAIGAFAEERRAQRDAEHEELWRQESDISTAKLRDGPKCMNIQLSGLVQKGSHKCRKQARTRRVI